MATTLRQRLLALYPAGFEASVDTADDTDFMKYLGVIADTLQKYGYDLAAKLELESCPVTASDLLVTWEKALDLTGTRAALGSSLPARQAQILSRLRERGPLTPAKIRAVVAPLLGYTDPATLVIKTTSRSELRTLHTYATGSALPATIGADLLFWVRDDAKTSAAGAQVDVTLSTTALEGLTFTLYPPRGVAAVAMANTLGTGAATSQTYRLFFPAAAGAYIADSHTAGGGLWRLSVAGTGTVEAASLFCEATGRDVGGGDGLGAAAFWWSVVVEDALAVSPDFDAAASAIARIDQGTRRGGICRAMTSGELGIIPGDANALPGALPLHS